MKWKIALPFLCIIVSPWAHRLVYENLLYAWPTSTPDDAWAYSLTLLVCSGVATAMIAANGELKP